MCASVQPLYSVPYVVVYYKTLLSIKTLLTEGENTGRHSCIHRKEKYYPLQTGDPGPDPAHRRHQSPCGVRDRGTTVGESLIRTTRHATSNDAREGDCTVEDVRENHSSE